MSDLLSQEEMEDLGLEAEQVSFVWLLIIGLFLFIYLSTNYNLYVLRDFI